MNLFQQTIKNKVSITGTGLHTGKEVTVTFCPATANHGLVFQRIDLESKPLIPADCNLVTTIERGTTLEKNGAAVSTVEHLLAAVVGLQIDNLLIEVNGVEIPIMDGSSIEFLDKLLEAGIEEQEKERYIFELKETIKYYNKEKDVEMLAMPSDDYKITTLIDYQSPVLAQQHSSLNSIEDFKKDFSEARTFCFLHELEFLVDQNLIKGGDLNNAIVVVDKEVDDKEIEKLQGIFEKPNIAVEKTGILNNVSLRYPNEPARHKLLDVIGDLALIGTPIKANIIAKKPGHKTNVEFAKMIKALIKKEKRNPPPPHYDPNKEPIYNIMDLHEILPHRSPFLLVDKVISLTKTEVVAVKNVTFNEPFFAGHFPGNPVMPGVLQIEAMAQSGGVLALNTVENPKEYDTYFLKINNVKFKGLVRPGDTLIFKLELLSPIRRGIVEMKGIAFVGNKIVTEAVVMARIQKRTNR